MTYQELITRASLMAFKFEPTTPLARFQTDAVAIFPSVVEELALSVACNLDHPWRGLIADTTSALTSGDLIPTTGVNGSEIIGEYGIVKDADDSEPLVPSFSLAEIRRLNQDPGGWRKISVYAYQIVKPRIYHTRPTVTIDVCVYDPTEVATAISNDEIPLFPDAVGAYVVALVDKLVSPATKFSADYQRELTGMGAKQAA